MKRALASLALAAVIGAGVVPALGAKPQVPNKITICHATASATNPFVLISPAAAGVLAGHVDHHHGDDVIPPFQHRKGSFAGQNWDDAGRALHAAGCDASLVSPPGDDGGPSF
jgi:hypothetical protein